MVRRPSDLSGRGYERRKLARFEKMWLFADENEMHICQDVFHYTRALHTYTTHIKRKISNWRNQPLWFEGHPITLVEVMSAESSAALVT